MLKYWKKKCTFSSYCFLVNIRDSFLFVLFLFFFFPTAYINKWILNCIFVWGFCYASLELEWNNPVGVKCSYIHFKTSVYYEREKFSIWFWMNHHLSSARWWMPLKGANGNWDRIVPDRFCLHLNVCHLWRYSIRTKKSITWLTENFLQEAVCMILNLQIKNAYPYTHKTIYSQNKYYMLLSSWTNGF